VINKKGVIMDELTKNQIMRYTRQLYSCNSYTFFLDIVKENENMDNPYVYQAAGQWCIQHNYYEEALPYFKKAILYGCEFPNKIWNTQMADAVGSSIAMVLTLYRTDYDERTLTNLFIMGYCYLTNCINLLGVQAYESLSNRASLLIDTSNAMHSADMPMFNIPHVYAISDIYKSSIGLVGVGFESEARDKLSYVADLHEWLEDITVAGRSADEYTIQELVEIGEDRHRYLFEKFEKKLLNNEYLINEMELDQILNSLSRK
jgi:hypothetical protein